jgi:hypothetical protein
MMPFRSEAQRRYLWARHPRIARRWTEKYGSKPQTTRAQAARRLRKALGG